jgi:hypothetical protein
MHLAQCGLHFADGVWGPDGPSQPDVRKSQRQSLEDILRDLKPATSGGMLDALLCEVDEHGTAIVETETLGPRPTSVSTAASASLSPIDACIGFLCCFYFGNITVGKFQRRVVVQA